MSRRRASLKSGAIYHVHELQRWEASGYVGIIYWVGDGPEGDPATTAEHWTSVFQADHPDLAHDVGGKYKPRNSWYGWEGLPNALSSMTIEVMSEGDYAADQMRQETTELDETAKKVKSGERVWSGSAEALDWAAFFEAIDRVAENESDEDAWAVISKWRNRQLRDEER